MKEEKEKRERERERERERDREAKRREINEAKVDACCGLAQYCYAYCHGGAPARRI